MDDRTLIYDPESFLLELENKTQEHIEDYMGKRTEEWVARGNDGKAIRSSSLGTCIRQAYYNYYHERKSDNITDLTILKRMYSGFINEETQSKYLLRMPGKLHGVESEEQNQFPIHLKTKDKIVCTATTDFVKEFTYRDQPYYIPMELKSTELWKWDDFKFHPYHLKQILLWVYYAKEKLKLNVPYAILLYTKRSTMANKYVVIPCDTRFDKLGREIQRYEYWLPYIKDTVNTVTKCIKKVELPDRPTDVPKYICQSCSFLEMCNKNENIKQNT